MFLQNHPTNSEMLHLAQFFEPKSILANHFYN